MKNLRRDKKPKKRKQVPLLSRLSAKFQPVPAPNLTREDCVLVVDNLPPERVIFDIEGLSRVVRKMLGLDGSSGRRNCDYVILATLPAPTPLGVILVEKKRAKHDVAHAISQLIEGAKIAEMLAPPGSEVRFRPVLLHGKKGGFRKIELNALENRQITFRGKSEMISKFVCGEPIGAVLN